MTLLAVTPIRVDTSSFLSTLAGPLHGLRMRGIAAARGEAIAIDEDAPIELRGELT